MRLGIYDEGRLKEVHMQQKALSAERRGRVERRKKAENRNGKRKGGLNI